MGGPWNLAGIVQGLVCKPSKLEMRVRFPLPAPSVFAGAKLRQAGCTRAKRNAAAERKRRRATCRYRVAGREFWACAGVGEPGQTVNLLSYD